MHKRDAFEHIRKLAFAWIIFVAAMILFAIGGAVYLVANTSPGDIGRYFGHIVSGFNEGQSDAQP